MGIGPVGAPRGDAMGGGLAPGPERCAVRLAPPPGCAFLLRGEVGGALRGSSCRKSAKLRLWTRWGHPPPPPRLILGAILGRPHSVLE